MLRPEGSVGVGASLGRELDWFSAVSGMSWVGEAITMFGIYSVPKERSIGIC